MRSAKSHVDTEQQEKVTEARQVEYTRNAWLEGGMQQEREQGREREKTC